MYPDTRRGSTGSHLGELEKDKRMRLVSDTNRRAERQLERHLREIDQHLQVNLKQIDSDHDMKSSSTSPPVPSPSPKYLSSSTDSTEGPSHSPASRTYRLTRPTEPANLVSVNQKSQPRKGKQQNSHVIKPPESQDNGHDSRPMQAREKTFTIIDHGVLGDAETETDNGQETVPHIRDLDSHDKTASLIKGRGRGKNIRNESVKADTSSRNKAIRSEYDNGTAKSPINNAKNRILVNRKTPVMNKEQSTQLGTLSPKEIAGREQNVFVFTTGESNVPMQTDKKQFGYRSKIPTVDNESGHILAGDEWNRRQLRKMHILSNLNKKHMRDLSNEDIFLRREQDLSSTRKFSYVTTKPSRNPTPKSSIDIEKPRPKSAMFSSQRRPCFTSEDEDGVFLDDLNIIDIADDGQSSDDDDFLSSSFVGPLHATSRHPLGLKTRSTSDISPSSFHRGSDTSFHAAFNRQGPTQAGKKQQTDHLKQNFQTSNLPLDKSIAENTIPGTLSRRKSRDETPNEDRSINRDKIGNKQKLSPKSEPDSSTMRKDNVKMFHKEEKSIHSNIVRGTGRALPAFPRKLKPIFRPENLDNSNNSGNGEVQSSSMENLDLLSDKSNPPSPNEITGGPTQTVLQRSSSLLHQNKKLQRSRQKTWTPGVGSIANRDLLKRPLGPPSTISKPRNVKSEVRTNGRRRARTSSELKKCSVKEIDSLKSGDMNSIPEQGPTVGTDCQTSTVDFSERLRGCRYLRTKSDTDQMNALDVESC